MHDIIMYVAISVLLISCSCWYFVRLLHAMAELLYVYVYSLTMIMSFMQK